MSRKIALSSLSLLPGSLFFGPAWSWKMAKAAGYDALKVNPLRGWDMRTLSWDKIPVTAFEYLWRPTFQATVKNLREHKDWMGFVADTCFIGYQGAERRCDDYAWSDYPECEGAVRVDFPSRMRVPHRRHARETECSSEKWPLPLDDDSLACLDTWHVRSYPDPEAVTDRLIGANRVALIDAQTRDFSELLDFVLGSNSVRLFRQLRQLGQTPESVSVSVELDPRQVWRLMWKLQTYDGRTESYLGALRRVRKAVWYAIDDERAL